MNFIIRQSQPEIQNQLVQDGLHPLLAKLYVARGITQLQQLDTSLATLHPPQQMLGIDVAGQIITNAIQQQLHICIIGDYDCDGATACSTAILGLKLLGANKISYIVPNRVTDGYGLTENLAQRAQQLGAQLIITVDNGISSIDGVKKAKQFGLQVIITDHHLPAQLDGNTILPTADAIVNPNQPGCQFPSKNLAGVGVMFYVLLATRATMRQQNLFRQQPKLDGLLPLVALGTIADVVKLDQNNRILVEQGLQRIRQGKMPLGLMQLFAISGRSYRQATCDDLSFFIAPRINAAGRIANMELGICCLTSDDNLIATNLAKQLDDINSQRRELEFQMRQQAQQLTQLLLEQGKLPQNPSSLCLYDELFHEGIVGIVAARIKEKLNCPTFIFAASQDDKQNGILKGSGRSIANIHIKDVLDSISKAHPNLLLKFGGHAMAAGCSIYAKDFKQFRLAFAEQINKLSPKNNLLSLETDGELAPQFCTLECAQLLKQQIWGQGFSSPVFNAALTILSQRTIGEHQQHSSFKVDLNGKILDATWFGHSSPLPEQANLAFSLDINQWRGNSNLTLRILAMQS